MKKSEAKRRIQDLRIGFETQFALYALSEQSVRSEWLDIAIRLTADIFGTQDELYKLIISAQDVSEECGKTFDTVDKSKLNQKWHHNVDNWLNRMSANIHHGTNFEETEIQNTKWFVVGFPIMLAILVTIFSYLYSQKLLDSEQRFLLEQIENENKIKLASVLVEFEYWSKGVQAGHVDSVESIAANFASRGVYQSGGYIKAVHKWALRTRFSLDSSRSSYFASISSLGGDTSTLNAPRKLGVRVDLSLSGLAKRLEIDISHLRLDTL